jgi:tRNA uridine 5-carboxymethylaminomethyl modification enzyme
LSSIAEGAGLYSEEEKRIVHQRMSNEDRALQLARESSVLPAQVNALLTSRESAPIPHSVKIIELARRPELNLSDLFECVGEQDVSREALLTAELEIKYAGYFERERLQAEKLTRLGDFRLSADIPYEAFASLSFEARQKLGRLKPSTLAQASRVPGVSPSDLQNLVLEVERLREQRRETA